MSNDPDGWTSFVVRFDSEDHAAWKAIAKAEDRTMVSVLRRALHQYIERSVDKP